MAKPRQIDERLREWATPAQITYMDAIAEHGGERAAARALGTHKNVINASMTRLVNKAAMHGYAPNYDLKYPVAPGQIIKGVSTYYNKDGKPTGQWVKSSADQ